MVIATDALIAVMTSTPKKLQIAAMTIAFRTSIARVETQVAIAFGASVQPLTRITPSVRTAATSRVGFAAACRKNSISDISRPHTAHSGILALSIGCQLFYYTIFPTGFVKKEGKIFVKREKYR